MKKKFNFNNYKNKKVCMHCKTEKEAIEFCNLMHDSGKMWRNKRSYKTTTYYSAYEENTCYFFNTDEYNSLTYAIEHNFIILKWSDFVENKVFTKSDLQDFDILVRIDGIVEIYNSKFNIGINVINSDGYHNYSKIQENLTDEYYKNFDIMKVYRPYKERHCYLSCYKEGELVFDRERDCPTVKEISIAELEKQYGCKIKIVN